MLQGSRIAAVVPAYNEAKLIERTLRTVPAYVDRIIVIDDASADDTSARALGIGDPRVHVVRHVENRGVGAAIATGYRMAFAEGADVAAVLAGDGQMDPGDLEALLAPVVRGDVEYAKGNRLGYPDARRHMPFLRWLGNHVLSAMTRWATGLRIRDSQCGYTALCRRAAERLDLGELWPRYGYPNDLLGAAAAAQMRVVDVVVRPVYAEEDSGIGFRHALIVVPFVLARVLTRRVASLAAATRSPRKTMHYGSR